MKENHWMHRPAVTWVMIVALWLFCIVTMGVEMKFTWVHQLDLSTFNWWMNYAGEPAMSFKHGAIDSYFTFFATCFDVLTVVVITLCLAVYYGCKKNYSFSLWLLLVVSSGGLMGIIFKDIFHRARPYDHLLVDTGYSFPSGHSLANSMLYVIVLVIIAPKLRNKLWRLLLCVTVSVVWISVLLSRLYFHAHFLTDVIGGFSFSLFWVLAFIHLYYFKLDALISSKLKTNQYYPLVKSIE